MVGSRLGWVVWGVPLVLFVVGTAWEPARAWLWVPSLVVAGTACLANASRCGRLHCFLTGPLFLLGAIATLVDAAGVIAIDWRWIFVTVIGGTAVGYGIEWLRGKYLGEVTTADRSGL
jgi:hypothetical protein